MAWLAPTVFATSLACLIAGMFEGVRYTSTQLAAYAATGFAGFYALPFGFVGAIIARLIWRAWRPGELAESLTDEEGGAPRLAAWGLLLFIIAVVVASFTFNWLRWLMWKSPSRNVVALGTTIGVVMCGAVVAALSRPTLQQLTRAMRWLERRTRARFGRTIMKPMHLLGAAVVLLCGSLYFSWRVSISPRIGHHQLDNLDFPAILGVTSLGLHLAWHRLRRRGALSMVALGTSVALAGGSVGVAVFVRHQRPEVMLEVWGDSPIAGMAIDRFYDLDVVRREMRLTAVAPPLIPGANHPNLLLITVDTLRADRLSPWGGPADTPTIDKLANQGTVFKWAFSPGNTTRRSLPTIATGVSPRRMKGRVAGWALKLDPRHVTTAERLRAAGYDTAGFFCCGSQFWPRHRLGLIRGFDLVEVVRNKEGEKVSARAAKWLAERNKSGNKKPWLMWIHYIELHNWQEVRPYPPRRPGERREVHDRRVYDAMIHKVDGFIATVLKEVSFDDTVVILSSDHGEGLSDHGHRYHSTTLYNSQTRVPLIVVGPGVKKQKIDQPVGLVSIGPTLIELGGYVPPELPEMDGPSLAKLIQGKAEPDPNATAYSVQIKDRSVKRSLHSIVVGHYKLIGAPGSKRIELYDIHADPHEKRNLAGKERKIVEKMRARLREMRRIDEVHPF
jgi:hypothetical protein